MARRGWEREDLWDNPRANIRDGAGPVRVVTGEPDSDFKSRPVGFAPIGDWPKTKPTIRELFRRGR